MEMKAKYQPKQYIELVERLQDPVLDRYMKDEFDFIREVIKQKKYHVIDLGAGYGRVISRIIKHTESITAIEIDDDMFDALEINQKHIENVKCLKEDITNLSSYLKLSDSYTNLFLLCQNTLGVIEGDYKNLLKGLRELGENGKTEVIISVFNKNALKKYGVLLYEKLKEMVGEIDLNESKLNEGVFTSQTGYVSKWWSNEEMKQVISLMNAEIISEKETDEYTIYHLQISTK